MPTTPTPTPTPLVAAAPVLLDSAGCVRVMLGTVMAEMVVPGPLVDAPLEMTDDTLDETAELTAAVVLLGTSELVDDGDEDVVSSSAVLVVVGSGLVEVVVGFAVVGVVVEVEVAVLGVVVAMVVAAAVVVALGAGVSSPQAGQAPAGAERPIWEYEYWQFWRVRSQTRVGTVLAYLARSGVEPSEQVH